MKSFEKKRHIDRIGTAAIITTGLCWTTSPLFIRYLTGYLDAWSQNLWRYTVAMIFWLPFLFLAIRQGKAGADLWKKALWPSIPNVLMQSLWAWGFYFVKPGFASLLSKSSLLWTAGFCLIYFPDERGLIYSKRFWLGIGLSITGVIMVIVNKEAFTAKANLTGIIIMLSSAAMWSVYTISMRIAFKGVDPRLSYSVVCVYTVGALAVLALLCGNPGKVASLEAWPLACVVISGILCMAFGHTLYYTAVQRLGATIPALVLQASPFGILFFSMIFFDERLNLWQWIGGLVLIGGSVLAVLAQGYLRKIGEGPG